MFFTLDRRVDAHGVGVFGRKEFQRRDLVHPGKMAGQGDVRFTVLGNTIWLWQTNMSGEAIHRIRTKNCLSKGQQNITFTSS